MINHYRIIFNDKKGFMIKRFIDTTINKAKYFQVYKNNKFLGALPTLKNAVELIISDSGEDPDLTNLLDNIDNVKDHRDSFYVTAGVTYTQKHGVRIEQRIRV